MSWPISWNEVNKHLKTPPLAHAETTITELVTETTVQFKTDYDETGRDYTTIDPVVITPDAEYIIMFDGVEYNCVAHNVGTRTILGNSKILNEVDTGEPFFMVASAPNKIYAFTTNKATHTFSISVKKETVTPIDKKFIPTLDYLRLKGANGKTYTVTVDANGELAVAEYVDPHVCSECNGTGKICGFMSGTIDPATGECSSHGTECLTECTTCGGTGKLA